LANVILGTVIDIILSCQTNKTNPLVKSPENNVAAIQSLLILPLDIIHVKERERIMKAWLPETSHSDQKEISYDSTALDPLVLSLKVKVMHRTTFYEVSISPHPYFTSILTNSGTQI